MISTTNERFIQILRFPLLMLLVLTFVDAQSSYEEALGVLKKECEKINDEEELRYLDNETATCYLGEEFLSLNWNEADAYCRQELASISDNFDVTTGRLMTGPFRKGKLLWLLREFGVHGQGPYLNILRDDDGKFKWQDDDKTVVDEEIECYESSDNCLVGIQLLTRLFCQPCSIHSPFLCQRTAIHCNAPSGRYSPTEETPSTKRGKLIISETATYVCDDGFFVKGAETGVKNQTVTCTSKGQLEPSLEPCVAKKPDTTTTSTTEPDNKKYSTSSDREELGKHSSCIGGPLYLPSNVKHPFNPTTVYPHNDNLVYPVECAKQQYVVGLTKVTRIQFIKCLNGNWTELMKCAERSCPNVVAAWSVSFIVVMLLVSAVAVPLIVMAYRKLETFDEDDGDEQPENTSTDGRKNLADLMSEDQTVKPGAEEPTEGTENQTTAATEQTTSGFTEAKSKTSDSTKSEKTSKSVKKSKSSKSSDYL